MVIIKWLDELTINFSSSAQSLKSAYRFLRRQVKWSSIPIYLRIFQSWLWSTQSKTLAIVNKPKVVIFLELSCFFYNPMDVGNLISDSSAFCKSSLNIWKFMVHVMLKPGLENFEHYFVSMWDECTCVVQFSRSAISDSLWPQDCSTPGLPVHHQIPESTQTHVHWVGNAIQPSQPLFSPTPPFNLSQHQGLSHESAICIR